MASVLLCVADSLAATALCMLFEVALCFAVAFFIRLSNTEACVLITYKQKCKRLSTK